MIQPPPSDLIDLVDELVEQITCPEDCFMGSPIGDQLVPALAALKDYQVELYALKFNQKFGKDVSKSRGQRFWQQIKEYRTEIRKNATPHRRHSGMATIDTSDRPLRELSREAMDALVEKNDPPQTFVRGGEMVYISRDEKHRPSIRNVDEAKLRGTLTRSADYMKAAKDSLKHIPPPMEIVRDILSYSPDLWPLPSLSSVTEIPTLRQDGTVLDTEGYDEASGVYYSPQNLRPITVPETPTRAEVNKAKELIEEAIGDFPFDSPASKANFYGLLLTPILRPAFSGCSPLAVIDAPVAGTGKSLLVNILYIIATGRNASFIAYPHKEEEMSKQISACLLEGRPLICFDNLEGDLKSPNLALAVTAKEIEARILGVTKNLLVDARVTWVLTGNNVKPGGDMARRCYPIRLDAKSAKPHVGRKFRHSNIEEWVLEHRAELLHALLVIARFWFANDMPDHVPNPVGSFESWHRTIGSVLRTAHIEGFFANVQSFFEEEDEGPREWEGFLAALERTFPGDSLLEEPGFTRSRYFSVAEVMQAVGSTDSRLKESLPGEMSDAIEKRSKPSVIVGRMLQKRRERRFGFGSAQFWLEREPSKSDHKGSAMWRVVIQD